MKRIYFILTAGILLAMVLTMSGCSKTDKIADITSDSAQYEGEIVNISGYVGNTIWNALTGRGSYQVDDRSGSIWVVTNTEPPAKGDEVSVRGTVSPAFTLGDITLGTVVNETRRH